MGCSTIVLMGKLSCVRLNVFSTFNSFLGKPDLFTLPKWAYNSFVPIL